MTCNYQPLLLPRPSVDNLRDLGGRPGHQGRPLKRGLLFRSAELSRCTPEDKAFLEELGIVLSVCLFLPESAFSLVIGTVKFKRICNVGKTFSVW